MSKSQLYFGEDDTDSDNYDNDAALPFPKPLDRSAFLELDFNAADFLSTLHNRFQTLEDLQQELQDLVRNLNKELVDLVNDNYTDFLSLGEKLKGGEERIEEVRVGLLGFQRDVTGVRNLVADRSEGVKGLLEQKRELRKQLRNGRTLLEVDERIEELEMRLGIARPKQEATSEDNRTQNEEGEIIGDFMDWDGIWLQNDESDMESDESLSGEANGTEVQLPQPDLPKRLRRNLEQLQIIQHLKTKCGLQHPFILAQRDRISQIKDVLRRDLENAVRNQPDVRAKQRIIQIRRDLDES